MRTLLASAALHISVAVAVSHGSGRGSDLGVQGQTVELYAVETFADPTVEPPPQVALPVDTIPAPTSAIPAAHPPAMIARAESVARGKPSAAPGPGEDALPVPEAPLIAASSSAPARFVMSFGAAAATYGGASSAMPGGGGDPLATETFGESGVSSPARLRHGLPPSYPSDARADGVEADVPLEIVVNAAGAVVDARALRHAGHGLDEAALAAVRSYTFTPAQREGRSVRVRMRWVVQFRIE